MAIYVELKNWVILPTKFRDWVHALEAMNQDGSFVWINWDAYNKFEIKRSFEMSDHPILLEMSSQPYDKQLALRSIAKSRQKDWKPVKSYAQLDEIYNKMKSDWSLSRSADLPFFAANSWDTLSLQN